MLLCVTAHYGDMHLFSARADPALMTGRAPSIFRSKLTKSIKILMIDYKKNMDIVNSKFFS